MSWRQIRRVFRLPDTRTRLQDALRELDLDRLYPRYGFPNDMLVHLNVWNRRVRDYPSRPIYGIGEESGIRIHAVVPRISWLLLKGFCWRLKEKYLIRDFHPLVLFYAFGIFLFLCGFLAIAQFSFWGNYLPRVYPTHLRGTGESFAANVGGRLLGTGAAWVSVNLANQLTAASPSAALAKASAIVALGAAVIGIAASFALPEPRQADLPS